MTFETAFKRIKTKFENVDSSLLEDMAIQFTLSDEDCGGTFYTEVKSNVLNVEPYDYKDNDVIIDIARKALSDILDSKTSFDKAIEKGEATVAGNLEKFEQFKNSIKKSVAKKKTATDAEKKSRCCKTKRTKCDTKKETTSKKATKKTTK
ncbi:MAG: SCP2 sterol-binding domain-containing protein [Clostridia bacterium]|nr:SCP2 sterol-binding domain-containing protein [Clostridia bacterium]